MIETAVKANFIRRIIDHDINSGNTKQPVVFRFPPEPNGYLHIGHAKSICLNFSLAKDYAQSYCYLRFDDTNPAMEEQKYIDSIQEDIRWLGFDWGEHLAFASDYFQRLYEIAINLIKEGKAYVCSLDAKSVRQYRGSLTEQGTNSPDRDRSIEDNLELFQKMYQGEFAEGSYTLRAKIDMASGNINMRDPAIYRIKKQKHHRVGDTWHIYPLYDFTHPLSDAIEGITHSLCTLEFQDHRPLYDWFIQNCKMTSQPKQIEFSRLNISHTVTSKRKLKHLVDERIVEGWDDPRMPTIQGFRRRGYTPLSIRRFCSDLGVSKQDSVIDMNILEATIRDDLNQNTVRRIGLINPIKVIIENLSSEEVIEINMPNHPQKPELGKRKLHFTRTIYIDRDDFQENPEKKFRRLSLGKRVRLSHAYVISCHRIEKDNTGQITRLYCQYDPITFGGKLPEDGIKVKGIIHWLSEIDAKPATVRLYERLFKKPCPDISDESIHENLNPNSLFVCENALVEPALLNASNEASFQWVRTGYFCADRYLHQPGIKAVFNRTVTLRESW